MNSSAKLNKNGVWKSPESQTQNIRKMTERLVRALDRSPTTSSTPLLPARRQHSKKYVHTNTLLKEFLPHLAAHHHHPEKWK